MSTTPFKYSISGQTYDDKLFGNLSNVSFANVFRNIGKHYEGVAIGAVSEMITINSGPTKATGTISIATGNMADADTITINSVVLTAKTTPTLPAQFKIGTTALQTAINLTALINGNVTIGPLVHASYAKGTVTTTGVVTVAALNNGTVGNYTWSQSGSNVTLSPSAALGGGSIGPAAATNVFTITASNLSAADTVTIGGTTFTAETTGAVGNQFNVGGSALITGQNLAAAINAYSGTSGLFSAVTTGTTTGIVTVTCLMPGTIGNNISVTKSAANGSWSHTTFFAGGTDANVKTYHKGI
jgi:hypothetical protein